MSKENREKSAAQPPKDNDPTKLAQKVFSELQNISKDQVLAQDKAIKDDAMKDGKAEEESGDPLVKSIVQALKAGDTKKALDEAKRILDNAKKEKIIGGQKYGGEESTDYLYDLYKVAKSFDGYGKYQLAGPFYEEGIKRINDQAAHKHPKDNEHKFSPLLGDMYLGAAREAKDSSTKAKYYFEAMEIYDNIYGRIGRERLGSERLRLMGAAYYHGADALRFIGNDKEAERAEARAKKFSF